MIFTNPYVFSVPNTYWEKTDGSSVCDKILKEGKSKRPTMAMFIPHGRLTLGGKGEQ